MLKVRIQQVSLKSTVVRHDRDMRKASILNKLNHKAMHARVCNENKEKRLPVILIFVNQKD